MQENNQNRPDISKGRDLYVNCSVFDRTFFEKCLQEGISEITLDGKLYEEALFSGGGDVRTALIQCAEYGFSPLYAPEIIDWRINTPYTDYSSVREPWRGLFITPSARITGKTKRGGLVVVYAHIPTSLSDPRNLLIPTDKWGWEYWADIPVPEKEFHDLLEQADNKNVFVLDPLRCITFQGLHKNTVKAFKSFDDHELIAYLGGVERAAKYFETHQKVYGNCIGLNRDLELFFSADDWATPKGHLLGMYSGHLGFQVMDKDTLYDIIEPSDYSFIATRPKS